MRQPNPRSIGLRDDAMTGEDTSSAKLAKLREAYEFAEEFLRDYGTDWKLHNKLCDMLKSALAEPLRNCDVGTADEQAKRFEEFCMGHHRKMIGNKIPTGPCECPCYEGNSCNYFVWAQMPHSDD